MKDIEEKKEKEEHNEKILLQDIIYVVSNTFFERVCIQNRVNKS